MDERDDVRPEGTDGVHGADGADAWSEDDVRRLLAEAHLAEPGAERVPDDVAARLDDVLAGLVAANGAARGAAETSDDTTGEQAPRVSVLAGRRARPRRRAWTAAAGIAAAVVVGGAVLGTTLGRDLGSDDAKTSGEIASSDGGPQRIDSLPSRAPVPGSAEISSDDLESDARSFLDRLAPVAATARQPADAQTDEATSLYAALPLPLGEERARSLLGCAVPGKVSYAVSYDGRAAHAVVEDPADGSAETVVRVLVCDADGEAVEVRRVSVAPPP